MTKTIEKKELYRKSETIVIKRSQIKFAPYNPKNHTEANVAQIKKNIKNVAFLGGIIWNKTTGNLIDGHKRVMTLDAIHRFDGKKETDYDVKVEMIELDLKTEKEQNIFQTKSRTDLDLSLVGMILPDIDSVAAGLDDSDLMMITVESPNFDFGSSDDIEDDFKEMDAGYDARKQVMIDAKKAQKANLANKFEGDPFVTLSFNDYDNKAQFMDRFGFNPADKYVKGEMFSDMIKPK